MEEHVLTVMIPTRNRKEALLNTLRRLQQQTSQDFNVFIFDNHSDYSIKDEIFPLLNEWFVDRITLHVRKCNVGGIDFIMCIEECKTKWGWLLGDDDSIHLNAVETILNKIRKWPDCTMMHFSLWGDKQEDVVCHSAIDVANEILSEKNKMKSGGDVYWISNKVYNIEKTKKYLPDMYGLKYCLTSHSIPLFKKMEGGEYNLFVNGESIADYGTGIDEINYHKHMDVSRVYMTMAMHTSILMDLQTGLDWKDHCRFVRSVTTSPRLALGAYLIAEEIPWNYKVYARSIYEKVFRPCYPWYYRLALKPIVDIISTKPGFYLAKKIAKLYLNFKHRKDY